MRRLSTALVATLLTGAAPADSWTPFEQAAIDGVWRSHGYGRLLVVRGGVPTLYQVAGRYCHRGGSVAEDDGFRLVRRLSPTRIAFAAAADQTHYRFDRIAALPRACTTPQPWPAAAIGPLVAATFADLYPGFGRRGRSRDRLTAALAGGDPAATPRAAFDRIAAALDPLDDAHVGLAATIDGAGHDVESGEAATIRAARQDARLGTTPAERERTWSRRRRDGIVALLDDGGRQVANRRILWGRIGRVGYLDIVTMGGFASDGPDDDRAALDAALDEAMLAFRGLAGVIVDVSNNRGGYDAISLHIAGRFADRRRAAFDKRPHGTSGPFQRFAVMPSSRPRYPGPVTLVTSDVTVSAGEIFVLAMRALPQVRHVGTTTRGALSDQLARPLPNGWTLTLPAEDYRDPAGRSQEGVGITPERPMAVFPDHAAAIRKIAAAMAAGG